MPESSDKKARRSKSSRDLSESEAAKAVPPHILNIVKSVEKRAKKSKKDHEMKMRENVDSIALIRSMMSSVRTTIDLSESAEEVKKDKEKDIKLIANARDIFKHLERQEDEQPEVKPLAEKVKRTEVKPDFLLEGQNKAEEIRRERLREMAAMKAARERQLEEEERWRVENRNPSDELRKQREREMEVMRMQRQQAMEEEEMRQAENRAREHRQISPGLAAARQGFKMEIRDEEEDRVERLRIERERELAEMRRARARQMEIDAESTRVDNRKSEAARELEAFRASRGQPDIRDRFHETEAQQGPQRNALTRAPRSKTKLADAWLKNREEDKLEELRRAREREMQMMLEARSLAIEEEEEERMQIEAARREEAERKGREMALLVAELQRMRAQTNREAEQDEKLTRYQEEMLQRVMELHAIARGGLLSG